MERTLFATPKSFPEKALQQANVASKMKITSYLGKRRDLRGKMVFSFIETQNSPAESAFSLYQKDGCWELGVHITDVAEYVCENSPLDMEASNRVARIFDGFSTSEMLPPQIINEACNLADKKDKLAISVLLTIDGDGKLKSVEFEESVIRVSVNCVYNEIDQLDSNRDLSAVSALKKKYYSIYQTILDLYELASVLCINRRSRGGLDCTYFKRVYKKDQDGKIISFQRVAQSDCRAMVREIGYFTAEAVGEFMCKNNIPSIYNGRDNVKSDVLDFLSKLVGIEPDQTKTPAELTADIADLAKGRDYYDFVCDVLKINVPRAEYSSSPIFNSLCACDHIVSFFNPASHYTDLLVQRVLKSIAKANYSVSNLDMNKFQKNIKKDIDLSNQASLYLEKVLAEYSISCATKYLKDSGVTQANGIALHKNQDGSIIVALECGTEGIIPAEYTKDYVIVGGKQEFFEIISISEENHEILLKPR